MDLGLVQNGHETDGGGDSDSGRLAAAPALLQTLTPALSQRERGSDTLSPDPLELIAEGKYSIEAVCRASGMSILELATHVCTPRNLEALGRVAELHAIEREMLLGKLKRDALVRLAELTDEVPSGSADEIRAFEVMRRACTDILRFGNSPTRSEGGEGTGGGYHPEPITPSIEAEVLEALERQGEEANQSELRARVSGPVELLPSSKAQPQATRDVVREVEVTHEAQVDMAFGKTSDHGTGKTSDHGTGKTSDHGTGNVSLSQEELATRTRTRRVPPAPPHDGLIGQGRSGHCHCCPAGGHEDHAGHGTMHGTVGLDHAHPP